MALALSGGPIYAASVVRLKNHKKTLMLPSLEMIALMISTRKFISDSSEIYTLEL
jgi:hypothetical protein